VPADKDPICRNLAKKLRCTVRNRKQIHGSKMRLIARWPSLPGHQSWEGQHLRQPNHISIPWFAFHL
jgi:hypothetical protein